MATQDNPPNKIAELPLTAFELPKWLVEPAVRSCRLFNTALYFVFYDVPTLRAALAEKDAPMQARGEKPPSRIIDFDALSDPEGSLLLIDATTAPYVHKYQSVEKFLQSPYQENRDVDIATITGVGSSALGSAALAWDISVALEKPVLAIVPGYGVADLVLQGLGGWFAFGLHDFLSSKTLIQTGLATAAPETACIGRELAASTPQEPTARGGAPIFRYGSGSSDVLHALLEHRVTPFRLLVGHSKGGAADQQCDPIPSCRTDAGAARGDAGLSDRRKCRGRGLSPISGPVRCPRPAQCLGSLARILAADLAQHQSRVAAGHGGRRDDFRVSARLKRSEAARRSSSHPAVGPNLQGLPTFLATKNRRGVLTGVERGCPGHVGRTSMREYRALVPRQRISGVRS